jgi:RNA polymerase sigma-70 factor (ECF subfamily)
MEAKVTAVWQEVQARLRTFIAKRVASQVEVEDLLQEVSLRMHRRIDQLNDPRRVVSWVYQITRHAIIDHYRKSQHKREILAGLASDMETAVVTAGTWPAGQAAAADDLRAELSGCLRPMIDRLAKEYREAVRLVELEGVTQQAAAKRMGLSLSGMKSRVQRGRKQLKRMLDDCCLIQLDRRRGVMDYEVRDQGCDSCGGALAEGRPVRPDKKR